MIDQYRRELLPLLRHYARRIDSPCLRSQAYPEPYLREFMLVNIV